MAEYIIQQGVDPKVLAEFKQLEAISNKISKSLKGFTITELSKGADDAMIKRLNAETAKLVAQEEKLRNSMAKTNAVNQQKIGYMNELEREVKQLKEAYFALNQAEFNGEQGGKTLLALKNKREELAKLKAAYGDNTMYVGQYSRATNGMRQAMMMLTGEMPNFAQSFRIGLMSLSNNWMGLSQAVAGVREEHKQMMKDFQAGLIDKKPDSVIKTITKSIFSFNLALMVVVTILQVFQEEIGNALEGLFKFNDAMKVTREVMTDLNKNTFSKLGNDYEKLRLFAIDYNKAVRDGNADRIKQLNDIAEKEYNTHKDRLTQIGENVNAWRSAFKEYLDIARKTYFNEALAKKKSELEMEQATIKSQQDLILKQLKSGLKEAGWSDDRINAYAKNWQKGGAFGNLPSTVNKSQLSSAWDETATSLKKVNEQVAVLNNTPFFDVYTNTPKKDKPTGGDNTTVQSGSMKNIDRLSYDKERIAVLKILSDAELNMQKISVNGEENSYGKRISAAQVYYEAKRALAEMDLKIEKENLKAKFDNDNKELDNAENKNKLLLEGKKITDERYNELHKEYLIAKDNLANNYDIESLKLTDKRYTAIEDATREHLQKMLQINDDYYAQIASRADSRLSRENFASQIGYERKVGSIKNGSVKDSIFKALGYTKDTTIALLKAQQDQSNELINAEIASNRFKLSLPWINGEKRRELEQKNAELYAEMQKNNAKYGTEIEIEQKKQEAELITEITQTTIDVISSLWDAYYAYQIQKLEDYSDQQKKIEDEKYNDIDDRVKAGVITQKEAEEEKARTKDYFASVQDEIDRQQKEKEKEKFLWEQAVAIAKIWMNAAEASSNVGNMTVFGAFTPLYFALASAQTALVAAQTIPYFKDGTDSSPEGFAVLGDGFKHELGLTKDGRAFISDNKPGLYELEAGTKIFPDINKLDLLSVLNAGKGNYHFKDDSDMIKELKGIKKAVSLQKGGNFYGMPLIRQINQSDRYANRNRSLMN